MKLGKVPSSYVNGLLKVFNQKNILFSAVGNKKKAETLTAAEEKLVV